MWKVGMGRYLKSLDSYATYVTGSDTMLYVIPHLMLDRKGILIDVFFLSKQNEELQ